MRKWLVEVIGDDGPARVKDARTWSEARRKFVDDDMPGADPLDRRIRCTVVRGS